MADICATPREVPVVIIGSGLAGLSLAIFLKKKGIEVEVFERHASLDHQGVETTVGVLFQECYRACGLDLTADLQRLGAPISEYVIWNSQGDVSSRERVDSAYVAFRRRSYDVSRPELMSMLFAKFEALGGIFQSGKALEGVEICGVGSDARAIACFSGGLKVKTPSLIGADGIRSQVRQLVFDKSAPEHAGASIVYGLLPGAAGLVETEPQAFHLCLADNFSVLTSHYHGQSPGTWIGVLTHGEKPLLGRAVWAEGRSKLEAGAEQLLASSPFLKRYLDCKPPLCWVYSGGLETRTLLPDFCWFKGPVLLIGDAVHGLTPWGGYSGQMAVEDAFVVAQHLAHPSAFADVVAERRPRVLRFQEKSAVQHSGGLGNADAVAKAQAERVKELTSCPAFALRVFVVGMAGRIGSAVARACVSRGAIVTGLARRAAAAPGLNVVFEGDVKDEGWERHLEGIDVVVCALRGMPGEVLPLQMRVLEFACRAGVPRFVAADFLPDYTPALPSLVDHPMLAERIDFRKHLTSLSSIAGLHVHIGCLLEMDELFGFIGVWDGRQSLFSYWGNVDTKFDVTTVSDAADATADALFSGAVGDLRVSTATVSSQDIVDALTRHGVSASLEFRGSLQELEKLIASSSGLERIRLQCQRTLFAGEAPTAGRGAAALGHFIESTDQDAWGAKRAWTSPTLPGLVQVDLKLDEADSDTALRAQNLTSMDLQAAWSELGRRELTSGCFHAARFVGQVLEVLDPALRSSGKLWFAAVACYFTGHFDEGVLRFDAEMASNPVDAEELIWRECCLRAAGRCPQIGCASAPQLVEKDPRSIFGFIMRMLLHACPNIDASVLERYGSPISVQELMQTARSGVGNDIGHDQFYAAFYSALSRHAGGDEKHRGGDEDTYATCKRLLSYAERMRCRDNIGLVCHRLASLPHFQIHTGVENVSYACPKLIVGFAGLKGEREVVERLQAAAASGAMAVDVADIYPGAEDLARTVGSRIVHTKYVPDESALSTLDSAAVDSALLRSMARLGRRPHAVQLHWWGGPDEHLARISGILDELRLRGRFQALGVTNMDVGHLEVVCKNAKVALGQFALSLVDRRPVEGELFAYCVKQGIRVIAYGVLCGGFITERWLGMAAPDASEVAPPKRKYLARILAQGTWADFQKLLQDVAKVAKRHNASIAEVAIAWVMHQGVSAVIVGPGSSESNLQGAISSLSLKLSTEDLDLLSRPSPQSLGAKISSMVYGDERDVSNPIGAALAPFHNASKFGPKREEEARGRAQTDPTRPFLLEELEALGLKEEADAVKTASVPAIDRAGLHGPWLEAADKLCKAYVEGGAQAFQAAMKEVLSALGAQDQEMLASAKRASCTNGHASGPASKQART